MKKTSLFLNVFIAVFLLAGLSSCDDDNNDDNNMDTSPKSIAEIASETSNLSSLVAALEASGLDATLSGSGTFTVFAPTNAAFQELLDSEPSWNELSDIPAATLETVLLFHVLGSEVMAADLTDGYVNTLAEGPNDEFLSLQVDVTGGVTFNGSAAPITTDIEASNGVVHVIDKVMLPKDLVGFALANPAFSSLVAALTDSRHTTDFVDVLSGTGPFTVFAPTNDAFQALLDSDPTWNSLADVPIATLDAVLKYHVATPANVQSDQLTDGQVVTMLSGDDITIDLSGSPKIETSSSQSVDIIITDVQGTNGVVHAIDEVLLP